MDLKKLARNLQLLMTDLDKDMDRVIPDGSDDGVAIRQMAIMFAGSLAAKGDPLSTSGEKLLIGLGLYGYVMGYRKGQEEESV